MTAQPLEYPSPPWVQLYAPTPSEEERRVLTAVNASAKPEEAWHSALTAHRLLIIAEAKKRLAAYGEQQLTDSAIREIMDLAWQMFSPVLHRATGPMIAEAYIKAFRQAGAGQVPIQLIYALAEEHVRRTGDYFNGTSTDAMVQGFNTYVNRQVPRKAALARVLDAYGLTPRQMSGMTSAKTFDTKLETSAPQMIKQKLKRYIGKSIADRLGIFVRQESHNLDQQAQQVAWMWMVDHGKLPETTEKMWVTARDERVCAICGPLHRQKIPLRDRFVLEDGQKLYVPGAHVNCRCKVRLLVPLTVEVGKADDFDPKEHPRDRRGRFVDAPEVAERSAPSPELVEAVRQAREEAERAEKERQRRIEEAAKPKFRLPGPAPTTTSGFRLPSAPSTFQLPSAEEGTFRLPGEAGEQKFRLPGGGGIPTGGLILPKTGFQRPKVSFELPSEGMVLPVISEFLAPLEQIVPEDITRVYEGSRFTSSGGTPLRAVTIAKPEYGILNARAGQVNIDADQVWRGYDEARQNGDLEKDIYKMFTYRTTQVAKSIVEKNPHTDEKDWRQSVVRIQYGPDTYLSFDGQTIIEIVNAHANRHMLRGYYDETVDDIEESDSEDNFLGNTDLYVSDIADALGLDDEMYQVDVVLSDMAHDNVEAIHPRKEQFTSGGPYRISGEMAEEVGRMLDLQQAPIPIRVHYVEPDVRSMEFRSPRRPKND